MASGKRIGKKSQASNDFLEPLAPTSVSGTNIGTGRPYNDGAVSVSFYLPALSPAATSYTVTASTGQTATGASSPLTVTGIASGSTPTFTVTATNAAGTSAASAASASVTVTTVPQAPTVSAANVGTGRPYNNGAATVTVTGGATGGSGITSYTATSSPGSFTAASGSPLTITGLASATAYTFSVTATNANGTSTATVTNSITATTVPQAPSASVSTGAAGASPVPASGNDRITFSANATGGSNITSYRIVSSLRGQLTAAATSPYDTADPTLPDASADESYTVYASNANGESLGASTAAIQTFTPPHFPPFFPPYFPAAALPGVPTGVTATNDGTNTTISWNAVSGATSYDIWYQSGPTYSGTSRDFGPITGTSYVTPTSSLFYYFVRAVNATGNGSYSAGVLATGGSTPPFFPPYFPGIRGY